MTIVGTRPEIIRLSEIIKKFDRYFEHTLVHTGQNWDYTLNQVFFENLKLREPDYYLESVGENLGETMGNIIAKSYDLLQKVQPDALLILGDTNSALSALSLIHIYKCGEVIYKYNTEYQPPSPNFLGGKNFRCKNKHRGSTALNTARNIGKSFYQAFYGEAV